MYNKIDNQVKAKTQMFFITDDDKVILNKILNNLDLDIAFSFITLPKNKNKQENYKEMHKQIKKAIKHFTGIDKLYQYETFIDKKSSKCYFFYLNHKNNSSRADEIINNLLLTPLNLKSILSILFSLSIKKIIIDETREEYDIPPSFYGDKLYIGSKLQDDKPNNKNQFKVDTFEPQIFFTDKSFLVFNLKNKTFLSQLNELNLIESEKFNNLMFKTKLGNLHSNNEMELDALQNNKSKFMQYKSYYPQCKNYSLHFMHKKFIQLLNKLNISYKEVYFEANYIIKDFIKIEPKIKREVILLDNFEYDNNQIIFKENLLSQIKEYLKISITQNIDNNYDINNLNNKYNYLCINTSHSRNGASIIAKNNSKDIKKELNNFLQAYSLYLKHKEEYTFDFYTTFKISNMEKENKIVTQGINIDEISKKDKENEGKYLYKEINDNKLKKIKKELWLKECIFYDKKIEEIELLNGKYTLFFNRNTIKGNHFISVVDIHIINKTLNIINNKIYTDINKFNFEFSRNVISKVNISAYNKAFYIYDNDNNILLTSYNSINIPRIIGNHNFNNIDYFNENNDLKKSNKSEISPLPYYLTPKKEKQSNFVFIQEKDEGLYYFVSQKGNPNISFDKQRLINSILTVDENNNKVKQLEQKVTKLFLSSFTDDILLNNEVSKSSILEKIAKEFILE